ncbi:unnamed protein product [Allacma fusca]|uniref:DNA-directed RNA polymerase subunit beta n=1 Tax=Allacma fusca TaxID=39272 RepID=A0A8J2NZ74_9HEXA|nr:unnamed protein product [Allacma fusca]
MICPNETPEGEPVGLVQNFALSACISVGCSEEPVLNFLKDHGLILLMNCTSENMKGSSKVFINGKWMGVHPTPKIIVHQLRNLRRVGKLNPEISIAILPFSNVRSEVHVQTDAGRIYRPLLIVEDKKLKLTQDILEKLSNKKYSWKNLLDEGIIEQLDTAEISNCYIAMWESLLKSQPQNDFTHCEIHPSMILGLSASTIPFANHNQAPRNTYQSGMAKQAVGLYATNFQQRCDLLAHIMHYPQKPLTTTFGAEMCNLWKLPAGQECIVAILSNGGYNQEDSIIVNQSSIERGLLRSSVYHAYVDIENLISAKREQDEAFERPGKLDVRVLKVDNYSHLEDDGLPAVGTRINEREVVIGKTSNNRGVKKDVSVIAKLNTHAVVTQALVTTNEDGQRTHKVVLQETRCPKIGDKFASRHGQKGVIGMIYSQENMPFAKNGIVPDVILNPHAIPSRMTIGHLVEALAAKAICLSPDIAKKKIDGTAFNQPITGETFSEFLSNKGYHKHGEEVLYDGATGIKLNATVFMGVNFYQRLKHMVDDKLNIRNRGAVTQLEGQPKRGLTREGAQRFGEMERDCTISHGAAAFLHERLFTVSDAAYYKICNTCGNLVSLNPFVNQGLNQSAVYSCRLCDQKGMPSDDVCILFVNTA